MAQRRMFALAVIDTDRFNDMPISARLLYYELGMRADDDGFVSSPKKIIRMTGCSEDDLRLLIKKDFVICFESGVIVITDWKLSNNIQADRYHKTIYQEEFAQLEIIDKVYSLPSVSNMDTTCIQSVSKTDTQVRLGKDRIDNIVGQAPTAYSSEIKLIVDYLNSKVGTNYKPSAKPTCRHITARLKEGYAVEDFKTVIDSKCAEWRGTDQQKYLRPETLFGSKFEGYLNAAKMTKTKPESKSIDDYVRRYNRE